MDVLYPAPEIDEYIKEEGVTYTDEEEVHFTEKVLARDELFEAIVLQACYLSFGSVILAESRQDFDEFMKKASGLMMVEDSKDKPSTTRYLPSKYPHLYDYWLDIKNKVWLPWSSLVPNYKHERGKSFSEILVPTVDTMRASWYVNLMNEAKRPLILVGDTGTSKSAILMDFLRNLDATKFVSRNSSYSTYIIAELSNFNNFTFLSIELFDPQFFIKNYVIGR